MSLATGEARLRTLNILGILGLKYLAICVHTTFYENPYSWFMAR